jgi:predicted DNA-binding protein with PD1-like motif
MELIMKSSELKMGRFFGVTFDHGKDFFEELTAFCEENNVKQAYIPMFIAGFSEAELVGTCDKLENPEAPVWSKVYLEYVDVIGSGTITYDEANQKISPHIHVSVGVKPQSSFAYTSHLISAKVLFLTEMLVIEVISPKMGRIVNPDLYNLALLSFLGDN